MARDAQGVATLDREAHGGQRMTVNEWTCENLLQGDTADPHEALHAASRLSASQQVASCRPAAKTVYQRPAE